MFVSTNYTNNGGVDNSTCDLKIDLMYASTIPASTDNYAAFAIFVTEQGYMYYNY